MMCRTILTQVGLQNRFYLEYYTCMIGDEIHDTIQDQ